MDEMIDRDNWASFLADVTQQRPGASTGVEVLDPELGDEREVTSLPLVSISYDHGDDVVLVELSSPDDPNDIVFRRLVDAPTSVAASPPAAADVTAIMIENASGVTLVMLDQP